MDRNLRAFLAIAETGNLSEAAEILRLTQPTLSKRLANLEMELGAELFERHPRGMHLTEAGHLYQAHARRIDVHHRQAREGIDALKLAGKGHLSVGAGPLFHLRYAARVFARLNEEFPNVQLSLYADTNIRTIPLLLDEELDIVLGPLSGNFEDETLGFEPVTTTEHGIVLPRHHPAGAGDEVAPQMLSDLSWVNYTENPESEQALSRYYSQNGQKFPGMGAKTTSFMFGVQLVSTGRYVMTAPLQLAPRIEVYDVVIKRARKGMPRFPVGVLYRKSSIGYAVVARFVELFRDLPDVQSSDAPA